MVAGRGTYGSCNLRGKMKIDKKKINILRLILKLFVGGRWAWEFPWRSYGQGA